QQGGSEDQQCGCHSDTLLHIPALHIGTHCTDEVGVVRVRISMTTVNSGCYYKSLMLAYRVLDGSAPTYLNALVRANVTPRMLRSSSERRLALPSVQVR